MLLSSHGRSYSPGPGLGPDPPIREIVEGDTFSLKAMPSFAASCPQGLLLRVSVVSLGKSWLAKFQVVDDGERQ
jgi:hypothetical protein